MVRMRWLGLVLLVMAGNAYSAPKWRFSSREAVKLCDTSVKPLRRSPQLFKKAQWNVIDAYKKLWTQYCTPGSAVTLPEIVASAEKVNGVLRNPEANEESDALIQKMPGMVPLLSIMETDGWFMTIGPYTNLKPVALTEEDKKFVAAAKVLRSEEGHLHPWRQLYTDVESCVSFDDLDLKKIFAAFGDGHAFQSKIYKDLIGEAEESLQYEFEAHPNEPLLACNCSAAEAIPKHLALIQSLVAGKSDFASFDKVVKGLKPSQMRVNAVGCSDLESQLYEGEKLVFGFFLEDFRKYLLITSSSQGLTYRFSSLMEVELEVSKGLTYIDKPQPHLEFASGDFTYSVYDEGQPRRVGVRLTNHKTGAVIDLKGDVEMAVGQLNSLAAKPAVKIETALLPETEAKALAQSAAARKACPAYDVESRQSFLIKAPGDGHRLITAFCEGQYHREVHFLEFDGQGRLLNVVKDHPANDQLIASVTAVALRDVNADGLPDLLAFVTASSGIGRHGAEEFPYFSLWVSGPDGKWKRDTVLSDRVQDKGKISTISEALKVIQGTSSISSKAKAN